MAETNRIEYKPTNINLKQEVNVSYELLKLAMEAKSIIFENNTDDLSLVHADNYMLQTILQNLLSNAIKFTESGGKISFESKIKAKMIHITVKDSGIGIDNKKLNKLFKIDESASMKGTADEKGTGLGLIICKEFISKHSGTINVESQKGKGSEFTFSIPKAIL